MTESFFFNGSKMKEDLNVSPLDKIVFSDYTRRDFIFHQSGIRFTKEMLFLCQNYGNNSELDDWESVCDMIIENYGFYDPVHVINNTCIIVMGLLMGEGDFAKTLCITMMGGYDTDCTCATVGSILGAKLGAKALPRDWIDPLNNRVESFVTGFERSDILDLANRTMSFVEQG